MLPGSPSFAQGICQLLSIMFPCCCCCGVTKSCPTLLQPHDPAGSSVHGILRIRILEWVAISFSRGSSQPTDQTWVSCIAGELFTTELPGNPISLTQSTNTLNLLCVPYIPGSILTLEISRKQDEVPDLMVLAVQKETI